MGGNIAMVIPCGTGTRRPVVQCRTTPPHVILLVRVPVSAGERPGGGRPRCVALHLLLRGLLLLQEGSHVQVSVC